MSRRGRSKVRGRWKRFTHSRAATALVVAFAVAVTAGIAVLLARGHEDPARVSDYVSHYKPPTGEPTPFPTPHLDLPAHPKVVVYGDSWASGYAAEPYTKGFIYVVARRLGWDMTLVRGGSGTGYLVSTPKDYEYPSPRYSKRILAQPKDPSADLVILQGSVNDTRAKSKDGYNAAVEAAVEAAHARYPNAELLLIGPVAPSPTIDAVIADFDSRLQFEANKLGFAYISPTMEKWLGSQALIDKYIAQELENHPDTRGHAYLARLLASDLRRIGA